MDTTLSITGAIEMALHDALMIYRTNDGRAAYVTHHNVANGQLGPATPLTGDFIKELSEQLRKKIKMEVLPANVLARTQDCIVWWTPAQSRRMYFTNIEGEKVEGLSGHSYPQPALVWMARNGDDLSIRALASSARPAEDTPLYVAPYWNVSDDGGVCLGDSPTPDTATTHNLDEWVSGFFKSKFSHPNATKIVKGAGLYHSFLKSIQSDGIGFPVTHLIDAKQTLGQFIGGE
jgi:PRTRC genetic system protein B